MKYFGIITLIISIVICGCSNENKHELDEVISIFQDSLLQEDFNKLMMIIKDETELKEQLSEAIFFETKYTAIQIMNQNIIKDEAVVKLEIEFEEMLNFSTEYIKLKGITTLQLKKTKNGWFIYEISSELSPDSERPPQK